MQYTLIESTTLEPEIGGTVVGQNCQIGATNALGPGSGIITVIRLCFRAKKIACFLN